MGAVVLEQRGQHLVVGEVVDGDDLELVLAGIRLRNVNRPMRPKPLMATRIATFQSSDLIANFTKNRTVDYSGRKVEQTTGSLRETNSLARSDEDYDIRDDPVAANIAGNDVDESAFVGRYGREFNGRVAAGRADPVAPAPSAPRLRFHQDAQLSSERLL